MKIRGSRIGSLAGIFGWLVLGACEEAARPDRDGSGAARNEPGTPIVVDGSSMVFDPRTVMRGSAGTGWGLGSYRVWILGRAGGQCVFELFDEIEGGFTSYLCSVPVDGPPVRIFEHNGDLARTFDLAKAEVLGRGNLHESLSQDPSPSLPWEHRPVVGTDLTVSVADLAVGSGGAPVIGSRVDLRATLFTDESRMVSLLGFEGGRTLRFRVGDGTAGAALEITVAGMQAGGTRLALVREEVAGILNETFGPFNPGTLLTVKLELMKVQ